MPSFGTNIVIHKIPLIEGCRSVKQKLRGTHINVLIKVKVDIEK